MEEDLCLSNEREVSVFIAEWKDDMIKRSSDDDREIRLTMSRNDRLTLGESFGLQKYVRSRSFETARAAGGAIMTCWRTSRIPGRLSHQEAQNKDCLRAETRQISVTLTIKVTVCRKWNKSFKIQAFSDRKIGLSQSSSTTLLHDKKETSPLEYTEVFVILPDTTIVSDEHELLQIMCSVKLVTQTGKDDAEQLAVMLNWIVLKIRDDADFQRCWISKTSTSGISMSFNRYKFSLSWKRHWGIEKIS